MIYPGAHGKGGGMSIEKGDISPVVDNVMQAGVELGYKIRDPNVDGPITEGFYSNKFFYKLFIKMTVNQLRFILR